EQTVGEECVETGALGSGDGGGEVDTLERGRQHRPGNELRMEGPDALDPLADVVEDEGTHPHADEQERDEASRGEPQDQPWRPLRSSHAVPPRDIGGTAGLLNP